MAKGSTYAALTNLLRGMHLLGLDLTPDTKRFTADTIFAMTDMGWFGDGADGDATITGAVSLSADVYYNNLTISGAGSLDPSGYRVFVKNTLDLSAAGANAIARVANNGGSSATTTAGTAAALIASPILAGAVVSGAGGVGGTGVGVQGGTPNVTGLQINGGKAGNGAAGGAGTPNAGGAARLALTISACPVKRPTTELSAATSPIYGGGPAPGGSSGGGDGTGSGGGGGGGGGMGLVTGVWARKINRGAGTAAGAIASKGGNGGNGGPGLGGTNRGGGSGGGGGGGGWVFMVVGEFTGVAATNTVDVSGGNGGNGGNGAGTGVGGPGSSSGVSGRFTLINLDAKTVSDTVSGSASVAGGAAAGTVGGTGGVATVTRYNI